ncbi:hypothetical protein Sked_24700 [Sanguibacter keddieii DSM 10542]|uniref:Dynamin N-terminal domain-containing protein n=1 Tax=Sanguibacter keddieii (strain ATCC 51767 / DSM 10542 / NCFB 3025 / ST-74) TaxID=446469 RepID=D1BJX3_SANKS|nr:dynamin family protein [Sanguibacter keddieii]ACZ22382.1 hypothetical protein Sked_24700 [Sanguibacter keddieii DSM 10542]
MADGSTHAHQVDDDDPVVVDLVSALTGLRSAVEGADFPLETLTAPRARAERTRALDQLDDYLLPRLRSQDAPMLVVVGGSTGAGKSTLVNSILGERVTAPGALRPTTRSPVLVHHPLDADWFTSDRVFPHLARETGSPQPAVPPPPPHGASGRSPDRRPSGSERPTRSLRLVPSEALPRGLAVLDAPDVDSVVVGNRELAAQLLAAADLWLFVTTAARYADAVPWELLDEGAARRAQVAIVVDRIDPGAEVVADHLREMLAARGLGEAPVFVIRETSLVDGLLPVGLVAPVSRWLTAVGSDATARDAVVAATRDGVIDDLAGRTLVLADAADAQVAVAASLRRTVARAYEQAALEISTSTSDGSMLRGEVLARWQDFVGTGELMRGVEERIGRVRDAVSGFFRGRPGSAPKVAVAISSNLEAIVFDAADRAAERTYGAWQDDAAGAALGTSLDLSRASAGLRPDLAEQVRAWQGDVLALVTDRGAAKRGRARVLAVGVNGIGAALMIVVFASTGGLTGAEVGIAGGSVLLAQRLLEGVFGDEAVRALAREAHTLLEVRVRTLLDAEAARFTARLEHVGGAADAPARTQPAAEGQASTVVKTSAAEQAGTAAQPGSSVQPGPPAASGSSAAPDLAARPGGTGPTLRSWAYQVQRAASAERDRRATPVAHPTTVSLDGSVDPSAASAAERLRSGRLRGADLEVVDSPYAAPAPPAPVRRGMFSRLLRRRTPAEEVTAPARHAPSRHAPASPAPTSPLPLPPPPPPTRPLHLPDDYPLPDDEHGADR